MLNTGKETTVHAMGEDFTISRLALLEVSEAFCEWIKALLPDPVHELGEKFFNLLPPEEQLARIKEAEFYKRELACFTLTGKLAKQYLGTERGQAKFFQLLLLEHHPDMTERKAFRIAVEIGDDAVKNAIALAQGDVPGSSGNAETPLAPVSA